MVPLKLEIQKLLLNAFVSLLASNFIKARQGAIRVAGGAPRREVARRTSLSRTSALGPAGSCSRLAD